MTSNGISTSVLSQTDLSVRVRVTSGSPDCAPVAAVRQRVSFRSVKEAVEAARDGDQILLLRGIHNGLG